MCHFTKFSLRLTMRSNVLQLSIATIFFLGTCSRVTAQSPGGGGTIEGSVRDPSGAAVPGAGVTIVNRLTGYNKAASTDTAGTFRFTNVPPNPYHLEVRAPGF